MPWQATFKQDTVKEGEGTATATNGTFVYTDRIDGTNGTKIDAFVSAAKQKYAAQNTSKSSEDTIAAQITAKLGV